MVADLKIALDLKNYEEKKEIWAILYFLAFFSEIWEVFSEEEKEESCAN